MKRFLMWAALVAAALPVRGEVRVGLFQKELPTEMTIVAPGGVVLLDAGGVEIRRTEQPVSLRRAGNRVALPKAGLLGRETMMERVDVRPARENEVLSITTPSGKERRVAGRLEISAGASELLAINIVEEEAYVAAVTASEIPAEWPRASLQAQSVLVRTYLSRHRSRHQENGFDVCDLTHCQVYAGVPPAAVQEAVAETRGEFLFYRDRPAETLFHSTCGGLTASNATVWRNADPLPYLPSQPDGPAGRAFCRASPYFQWALRISKRELHDVASLALADGTAVRSVTPGPRDASERVAALRCQTDRGAVDIAGDKFYLAWGRARGWHELKSMLFSMASEGEHYVIQGRGLGHGVGLCQYGARGLAEGGAGYREILARYFPRTALVRR